MQKIRTHFLKCRFSTSIWPVELELTWILVQISNFQRENLIHWHSELFSCLAYSLFATSRHNSVGTFAVVALMTGNIRFSIAAPSMTFTLSLMYNFKVQWLMNTFQKNICLCLVGFLFCSFVLESKVWIFAPEPTN